MNSGSDPVDPQLAAALDGAFTLSALASLVHDETRPDLGPVAVLTMAPSVSVHTSDPRPGAELVDVVASALLGMGFALVTAVETAALATLPLLPGWRATLHTADSLLIHEPSGMFYDGDLGRPPLGWRVTARRRGHLVVLVASSLTLDGPDRNGQLRAASRAGRVVGAQLPLA